MTRSIIIKCLIIVFCLLCTESSGLSQSEPSQLKTNDVYMKAFDLSQYRGRVVVFYFTNKNYASKRSPKYSSQSASYAFNKKLQFVMVFSPRGIPRIARGIFRKKLIQRVSQEEQKFATQAIQDHKDPSKIILTRYLTDWDLKIHRMFHIDPREEKFSIVVIAKDGQLKGHFPGETHYQDAVKMVEDLIK